MRFGWINLLGALIVVIMLIPNILFALKHKNIENKCKNVFMNCLEQIGRYSCVVLMWLPLLVWKFSFRSVAEMLIYLFGTAVLLMVYLITWVLYFKKPTKVKARILAILPAMIFLICGVLLRHWLLVIAAILFGCGHIYVTRQNE